MPTPQEILSDPNFQNLATGDQLTVMRKADPSFAALPPTEQGTVIARSRQKYLGTDKIGQTQTPKTGFVDRLKEDVSSIPSFVTGFGRMVSPLSSPAERVSGMLTVAGPNASEAVQATDKSLTPMERFGHGLASVIPFRGPMAAGVANDVARGDYGAAGADSLMLFSPEITNAAVPRVAEIPAVKSTAETAGKVAKSAGAAFSAPDWVSRIRAKWDELGEPKRAAAAARAGEAAAAQEASRQADVRAKSMARGANAPFRSLPEPKTAAPAPVVPIKGDLPSGRTPGGINDPRTIPEPKPASTAQKLPLWHMVRDQIVDKPADVEPIVATKTPSGRTPGGIKNQVADAPSAKKLSSPKTPAPSTATDGGTAVLPSGVVRIGKTPAEMIKALSSSTEGTIGTRAEMMRQLRLADSHGTLTPEQSAIIRRFEAPEYTPRPDRSMLQAPQTTVPATETPVAQSGPVIPAQSAAELLKTAGIGIDAVEKATPEQWKLIEKHVGSSVDQKATLEQMRSMETPAEYKQRIARTHAKFNAAGQRQ